MSTIFKVIDVLEALAKNYEGTSLADLAAATGLNKTTLHRYLTALVKKGYVSQRGQKGKYILGLGFLKYNYIVGASIVVKDIALPYLHKLCDKVSETVNVAVLDNIEAIGVAAVATDRILQVVPFVPNKYPLHCTSIGKVLMANMPANKVNGIIDAIGLQYRTEHTITDPVKLKVELENIKREGIAYDDEEYLVGVRSVAAPLKVESGETLAAISFVGPTLRINKRKMAQFAPLVKNCALDISRALGYKVE